MDKVSEKERSSRKSRDERDRDRMDSGRSSHHRESDRDRDRDRDREHHKHRHHRDERHHGDDADDAKNSESRRHQDQSRLDSPRDEEHRRGRSQSYDRARDSVERARVSREEPSRKRKEHGGEEDGLEPRRERSRSYERARDSVERGRVSREESVERRSSRKRKEHGGGNDDVLDKADKWSRVSDVTTEEKREEKRERRRFGDRVSEERRDLNGVHKDSVKEEEERDSRERRESRKSKHKVKEAPVSDGEIRGGDQKPNGWIKPEEMNAGEEVTMDGKKEKKRERRKFEDKAEGEEVGYAEEGRTLASAENLEKKAVTGKLEDVQITTASGKSGSETNTVGLESLTSAPKTAMATNYSLPTKVSSITTTNENEGVNVSRSDEVPGKFSTDGTTTSVAGKSGSLSLDALAKAKKALQMQKELSEKMKRIPMLNKPASSSADNKAQAELKREGPKVFSSSAPTVASLASSQPMSGLSTLPDTATLSVKPSTAGSIAPLPGLTTIPNIEAVKRAQELAAKMGFRHDPEFAPLINMFPGPAAEVSVPQRPSKAPVLRLDAQGREIDEHGNVINMPKLTNLSTLKVNINKQKKEAFQILRPELDANAESNPYFDARMGINKTKLLRPKRMSFQFVEEGKWSKQAEIIKFKSQFGEAQAKELKTKQAQLAKAKAEPDINPNLIEVSERVVKEKLRDPIPETEWWDLPILLSTTYGDVAGDKLNLEKITIYVEHPLPIEPPAEPVPPPPQPLKLTKKEQKKLRTQRRLAKERDRQEMIRQGLIEPPKAKIKMSNLMKVLGSEATQDPTRLEMEIRSAAAEREQAHVDRNSARKLTPAERREKKEKKLFEDPNTLETIVSVYKVNHLSHPKTCFQVDVNAQENRMTGCAVISEGICIIVVEGGKKSNKRYKNLMLKRIDWAAAVAEEEEGDESLDTPVNKCVLVWQGSVAKPNFNRFLIHQCRTEAAARKVFADAGVGHYWDLAANFCDEVI